MCQICDNRLTLEEIYELVDDAIDKSLCRKHLIDLFAMMVFFDGLTEATNFAEKHWNGTSRLER